MSSENKTGKSLPGIRVECKDVKCNKMYVSTITTTTTRDASKLE